MIRAMALGKAWHRAPVHNMIDGLVTHQDRGIGVRTGGGGELAMVIKPKGCRATTHGRVSVDV
jgi:hypothetical protein